MCSRLISISRTDLRGFDMAFQLPANSLLVLSVINEMNPIYIRLSILAHKPVVWPQENQPSMSLEDTWI